MKPSEPITPRKPMTPDQFEAAMIGLAQTYRALVKNDPAQKTHGLSLADYRARIWVLAERHLEQALDDLRAQRP